MRMPVPTSARARLYSNTPVDHFGHGLIEGLDDAVVVTDAHQAIIAWNSAIERLRGIARTSARDRSPLRGRRTRRPPGHHRVELCHGAPHRHRAYRGAGPASRRDARLPSR